MNAYHLLAVTALALHLVWITWIILGWLVTRNRPLLRWFHILSLVYSILIEIFLWPCPLTIAEQWLQARAGMQPYQESFLTHYLEALVYPNISQTLLTWCAVGVCLFILGLYGLRFRRRIAFGVGIGAGRQGPRVIIIK